MLVELNKASFRSRTKKIYDAWNNAKNDEDYASIAECDGLLLVAGEQASEDEPIRKGTCLQQWLLGYEFPSTITLFQKERVTFLCSAKKAKILSQIEGSIGGVTVEVLAQAGSKEPPNDSMQKLSESYSQLQRVGTLAKENHTGKFVAEWNSHISKAESKPEAVDMTPAVSAFMAAKDEEELKAVQTAGNLTSILLKHHVAGRLESILDREATVTHEALSAQIEARLGSGEGDNQKGPDMKVWGERDEKGGERLRRPIADADLQLAEFCYSPIIISRSSRTGYDLRFTAESTRDNIAHKGVILFAFGMRYKSYCANLGRTFIVDPTPVQEQQYGLLLTLQTELLNFIHEGVTARDCYQHAISIIRGKDPSLEKHFVKNIGFGMGIEFRDSAYLLSAKNAKVLKANMIFNLGLGFSDLEDSAGQKYALHLVDTIKVEETKSILLTEGMKSGKQVLFFLTGESEEEKPKKAERKPPVAPKKNGSPSKKTVAGKVLRNTRRAAQDEEQTSGIAKLAAHQRELHAKLQKESLEKYSDVSGRKDDQEGKTWKKFQSYKGDGALPPDVEKLRIFVDRKAQTVILPINGFAVPFHINVIKNASKSDEGEFTFLRINFNTPGQPGGKKDDTVPFEDPDATFIRSVSYRSADGHRLDSICRQITELKRDINKREQQKKEMADVVEQASLIELKGRRPIRMSEAFIRPPLDGKRLPGDVEIHQNGIRFQSPLGQKIDVLFSNIKHLFFQPCDHELLVIVHMHLKAPLMIGKKKTFDIQFYKEATDVQFDETGNRKRKHRYGDEDEIEMEQQERKRRQLLNKEAKAFADRIAEAASASTGDPLELDIPFRELSFEGVPHRTSVRLQPTTDCLVFLTDMPFVVVTLTEIEIASLERVNYGLKQFDMCLIFKDFSKPPLHINSITSSQLDDVKNWLDSVDIPLTESPVNLNWPPIMKHVNEAPLEFFEEGGWGFLTKSIGVESEESADSASESDFEMETYSSESSEAASEFSDASGSDGSGSFSGSDDDSGEDWDELERKAAKSDQKRGDTDRKKKNDDDSEDDRPRKSAKANGKANGKPKKKN